MIPFIRSLRSSKRLVTFSKRVRSASLIYSPPSNNPPPLSLPASREPRGSDNKRPPSDSTAAVPSSSRPTPYVQPEPCGTPPRAPAAIHSRPPLSTSVVRRSALPSSVAPLRSSLHQSISQSPTGWARSAPRTTSQVFSPSSATSPTPEEPSAYARPDQERL